ncbi:Thiol-disulfide oxidoreductase resA [Chryseobacterium gleum]|uniref:Thiol-disulfide oxidoreductase resA n=2 Tax=Chryseobacterium gleum TaxID=250 RepID=A0A3S4LYN2_CHRGE|nr:TlpA disulfide reductase family protein [Chryseobacterium gleum]EFK34629.1 antioxidant, AhpC/TSA family [Chryseobacterium gleum ATCC 35910]QQY30467.1 TlpA family protein disulfide reductase [Chryseobacterium gleum]VEE05202.1 Thiol-disulfide oxidoreductase resA [Chryseobacterium gleum]
MSNMKSCFTILFLVFLSVSVDAQKAIEIGKKAPEITMTKADGTAFSLSRLKGKIVLIDFWATWCAPCVEEQPELKALYDTYSDKVKNNQFEILGISLDRNKESWQKAIDRFGISWIQISDLKFWKSPVAKLYEVDELPFNIIIDGQGTILAKNLHGKDLEEFLKKSLLQN